MAEFGAQAVVGRGLVEILPSFKKWGVQLAADMKIASAQMNGSAAGLRAAAATVGTSMAKVGKGVSLLGLGVAAVSVKMAGDFQAQTAVLQTAAGETASGLKIVRAGILDIAKGTGTGIQNLTDGMYLIEKAGFRGADGLKVLKAAAQGAREENANLSDVTNAMTSVMASYHLGVDKSVQVMNAMKTSAGEGKITMEEFSGSLSTVLPIASANKISFEQVAGALATLTQHGTSAREATQELASTIRSLAAPNNVAIREMARFGLSSVDVSTKLGKRGLTGTFDLLTTTILKKMGPSGTVLMSAFEGTKQSAANAKIMFDKMPPSLQKLASEFQAGKITVGDWRKTIRGLPVDQRPMLQGFADLVNRSKGFSRELKSGGPAAKTYTDALKKMSGGAIGLNTILQLTGESQAGFEERVKKTGESFHNASKDVEGWEITQKLLNVRLDKAKQAVKVLMIEIGTKLIPVVTSVIDWMGKHQDICLALVIALGALLAATVAMYVAMKVYAVVAGVVKAAQVAWTIATMAQTESIVIMRVQLAILWVLEKAYAVATKIAAAAQWLWNAAISANPIGLIIIAIAAFVAAIVLIATKTTWFQTAWKYSWNAIKTVFFAVYNFIKTNWPTILIILTGPIGAAVVLIVKNWKTISDGAKTAFNAVTSAAKITWTWIKSNWPLLLAIMTGPIGIATLAIVRNWSTISSAAKTSFAAVTTAANATWTWIKSHWQLLLVILTGPIGAAVVIIVRNWKTISNTAKTAFGELGRAANDTWTKVLQPTFRFITNAFLTVASAIVHGAATAFGWVPGIGGKLKGAAKKFDEFRSDVNKALGGISAKPVPVSVVFHTSGGQKFYATGGAVNGPGTETSDSIPARLSKGEHVWTAREVRGAGGHGAVAAMRSSAASGNRVPGFAAGGGVNVNVSKPSAATIRSLTAKAMLDLVKANAKKLFDSIMPDIGAGGGSGVTRWTNVVKAALAQVGQSQSYVGITLRRMNQESGGNPNAVNRTDSNWIAGYPSVGLMQVIRPTFQSYAGKYRSTGPFMYGVSTNPMANVYSSMRYALGSYGSLPAAYNRAGGYANGTNGAAAGYHWLGENGPELRKLRAGDQIKTNRQSRRMAADRIVHLTVENHGVIGSKHEVENWLVEAFDQLRRKGRV